VSIQIALLDAASVSALPAGASLSGFDPQLRLNNLSAKGNIGRKLGLDIGDGCGDWHAWADQ